MTPQELADAIRAMEYKSSDLPESYDYDLHSSYAWHAALDAAAALVLQQWESEWQPIIERAASLIGSEYRNSGVVLAALDWQEQTIAEQAAEIERLKLETAEYKRLYELRGKALQRPCMKCGYQQLTIKTAEGS